MAKVTAANTPAALEELAGRWDELLRACPDASIFQTWEWLSSWWSAFGSARRLLALEFWDREETLVALGLFSLVTETVAPGLKITVLEWMGDGSGDSDNLGLLVRPGCEEDVVNKLLEYLQTEAPAWDICRLKTMDPNSPAVKTLLSAVGGKRWRAYSHLRPWTVISLPETWELYRKKLSSKERGKLGTRTRRLEGRYPTVYHKCITAAEVPERLEMFYELHAKRWRERGRPGSFVSPERRAMYLSMANRFLERGWLEFWFLELDRKPVAALYGFRYRDRVYSLQEGYDPEYSSDSVGYVLRGHVLKRFIEEGVRTYDFLEGKDPSKERWGAHVQSYVRLEFAPRWTKGSLYLATVRNAGLAKEWIRQQVSPGIWKALHELNLRLKGKKSTSVQSSEED